MGAAAGVEAARYEDLDYETLKKSGIDFGKAHNALDRKLKRSTTSAPRTDDVGSIHYFAMRQLSHNLKNQDRLNEKKYKLLKSCSVPNNLIPSEDDEFAHLEENDETLRPDDLELMHDEDYQNMPETATESATDDLSVVSELKLSLKPKPKVKKPKLNLSLQLTPENSLGASLVGADSKDIEIVSDNKIEGDAGRFSPSSSMRISPRGTVYVGKYKLQENGISLAETARMKSLVQDAKDTPGGIGTMSASMARKPPPALVGGKQDFIEIVTLGSGASGVVSEALHVPTLTLVALKMLPVYNKEKRRSVSRELAVLYKNLADLELVDDLGGEVIDIEEDDDDLNGTKETITTAAAQAIKRQISNKLGRNVTAKPARSPHILSLYNAFVDPRSGMINLVIEYMDGGSLEDLVKQGGCRDELVLADICFQTCKGLEFLHKHHHIHRDIKPANILCSSSGQIKIADFGIAKAMDKTSSFAHSFVGTVCYMSPERITGDNYTYSGDIWSLGLTILAVANGKFPLSGKEKYDETITGSDYDTNGNDSTARRNKKLNQGADAPSNGVIGGAAGYWAMIKAICDDEPPVAGPTFSVEFNDFIAACLKKDPQERLRASDLLNLQFVGNNIFPLHGFDRSAGSMTESNHAPVAVERRSFRSRLIGRSDSSSQKLQSRSSAADQKNSQSDYGDSGSRPVTPSALGTRLTNAAIERRASRDMMRRSAGLGSNLVDVRSKSTDFPSLPLDPSQFQPGDVPVSRSGEETGPDPILMSIRLEHLDRLLDKIEQRLEMSTDEGSEQDELDVLGIHDYSGCDFSGTSSKGTLQQHSSLDSMDDLLQYKDELPVHIQGVAEREVSGPNRNPSQRMSLHALSEDSGSECDHEQEHQRNSRSKPPLHASAAVIPHPSSHEDLHELPLHGGRSDKSSQQALTHSILKGTSSYAASHGVQGGEDSLRPEEKRARWAAGKGRQSDAFNSSNRSVHFSEGGDGGSRSAAARSKKPLRPRLNLQPLEIDESYGDDDDSYDPYGDNGDITSSAIPHPKLPKTSSYFIHTKGDTGEDSTAHIREQLPQPRLPDIRKLLPRLNRKGATKWENLATQLHVPLHLVKTAVKAKLGHLIDLQEEII